MPATYHWLHLKATLCNFKDTAVVRIILTLYLHFKPPQRMLHAFGQIVNRGATFCMHPGGLWLDLIRSPRTAERFV